MRRRLKSLAIMNAVVFSGIQSLTIALYPFLAEKLNLHLSTLIGAFALGSFLFVFGSPFWSNHSDSVGRRKVLTIGSIALLISFTTLVVLVNHESGATALGFAVLALSRIVYGLIASATAPVAQSLQADLAGEERAAKGMLLHSMSLSLGRVLGLISVIFVSSQINALLLGWLTVVSLIVVANLLLPAEEPRLAPKVATAVSWRAEFSQTKWLLATALLFTCFVEALNSSLGGTIRTNFGLESIAASALTAQILLTASVGILLVQLSGKLFRGLSTRMGILIGVSALSLGSLIFASAHSMTQLWISVVVLIVGIALLPPFYMAALRAGCAPEHYGRRAGLMASSHTIGYAIGGAISALAFRFAEFPVGYILAFIAVAIALVSSQHAGLKADSNFSRQAA